jgi:hypothetical protein
MISLRYGVRLVRHGPGDPEDFDESVRFASAHSDTVCSGLGFIPRKNADLYDSVLVFCVVMVMLETPPSSTAKLASLPIHIQ